MTGHALSFPNYSMIDEICILSTNTIRLQAKKKAKESKWPIVYSKNLPQSLYTLIYRINAHVRLFIFQKKSCLCDLIRYCALINFEEKSTCAVFLTLLVMLPLLISCALISYCAFINFWEFYIPVRLYHTVRLFDRPK